ANVSVTLIGTDVNLNAVTATAQTDATGFYTFTDLLAGTYTVTELQVQPALVNYYDGAALAVTADDRGVLDVNFSGTADGGEPAAGTRGFNDLSAIGLGGGEAV